MLLGTIQNSYDGPNNEGYDLLQISTFSFIKIDVRPIRVSCINESKCQILFIKIDKQLTT